jgi:hypothetical protein
MTPPWLAPTAARLRCSWCGKTPCPRTPPHLPTKTPGEPPPCPSCGGVDFWTSAHGVTLCRRCHPPDPNVDPDARASHQLAAGAREKRERG